MSIHAFSPDRRLNKIQTASKTYSVDEVDRFSGGNLSAGGKEGFDSSAYPCHQVVRADRGAEPFPLRLGLR